MLNKFQFLGRITNDIEIIESEEKGKRCYVTIACDGYHGTTDFPSVVLFGNKAENLVKYKSKGDLIYIEGHVSTVRKEINGEYRYYENHVGDVIKFVPEKKNNKKDKEEQENIEDIESPKEKVNGFENEDLPF